MENLLEREVAPWNVYVGPFGAMGRERSRSSQVGFNFHSIGALVGADCAFDPVGFGASLNYERIDGSIFSNSGYFNIDKAQGSLYAAYAPKALPQLSLNAILGGGYDWVHLYRTIGSAAGKTARGNPKGAEFDALFGVEYTLESSQIGQLPEGLAFTPLAEVQYIHLNLSSYQEKRADSFNLSVGSQKVESLRTLLGSRFLYQWKGGDLGLKSEIDLFWQREYLNHSQSLSFTPLEASCPTSSLTVLGGDRNTLLGSLDFLFTVGRHGVEAAYDLTWSPHFYDHYFYFGYNIRI
jgi:outer membrane autotransporter protein